MRIGHGYDVHRFAEPDGEPKMIALGGVEVPSDRAIIAHSDGDVMIHALCDALLGAAGLGDIGHHFPDTDPAYKGISSRKLLTEVIEKIAENGYVLGNADLTLVAEKPKVARYIESMRQQLAADMGTEITQINVKATTTEGLGFEGRGEGIAAHAVVLLLPGQEKLI
ncbi:MAG: 2-C-methyl-D-erythritol 2,4-cyclodiphosphate synthase [Pseudomonadales bacterium]|nr:2-C-methyl-D-erythritol 2,4-cyclodiphosphate synthase [Pseudomonadales bacterium]